MYPMFYYYALFQLLLFLLINTINTMSARNLNLCSTKLSGKCKSIGGNQLTPNRINNHPEGQTRDSLSKDVNMQTESDIYVKKIQDMVQNDDYAQDASYYDYEEELPNAEYRPDEFNERHSVDRRIDEVHDPQLQSNEDAQFKVPLDKEEYPQPIDDINYNEPDVPDEPIFTIENKHKYSGSNEDLEYKELENQHVIDNTKLDEVHDPQLQSNEDDAQFKVPENPQPIDEINYNEPDEPILTIENKSKYPGSNEDLENKELEDPHHYGVISVDKQNTFNTTQVHISTHIEETPLTLPRDIATQDNILIHSEEIDSRTNTTLAFPQDNATPGNIPTHIAETSLQKSTPMTTQANISTHIVETGLQTNTPMTTLVNVSTRVEETGLETSIPSSFLQDHVTQTNISTHIIETGLHTSTPMTFSQGNATQVNTSTHIIETGLQTSTPTSFPQGNATQVNISTHIIETGLQTSTPISFPQGNATQVNTSTHVEETGLQTSTLITFPRGNATQVNTSTHVEETGLQTSTPISFPQGNATQVNISTHTGEMGTRTNTPGQKEEYVTQMSITDRYVTKTQTLEIPLPTTTSKPKIPEKVFPTSTELLSTSDSTKLDNITVTEAGEESSAAGLNPETAKYNLTKLLNVLMIVWIGTALIVLILMIIIMSAIIILVKREVYYESNSYSVTRTSSSPLPQNVSFELDDSCYGTPVYGNGSSVDSFMKMTIEEETELIYDIPPCPKPIYDQVRENLNSRSNFVY